MHGIRSGSRFDFFVLPPVDETHLASKITIGSTLHRIAHNIKRPEKHTTLHLSIKLFMKRNIYYKYGN